MHFEIISIVLFKHSMHRNIESAHKEFFCPISPIPNKSFES